MELILKGSITKPVFINVHILEYLVFFFQFPEKGLVMNIGLQTSVLKLFVNVINVKSHGWNVNAQRRNVYSASAVLVSLIGRLISYFWHKFCLQSKKCQSQIHYIFQFHFQQHSPRKKMNPPFELLSNLILTVKNEIFILFCLRIVDLISVQFLKQTHQL